MAGGIFTDRPFEPNPKCIVFAFALMGFYWFIPGPKNVFLLPVIFVVAYVAMAWYDWIYDCEAKMFSGMYGPVSIADSLFKPQRRDDPKEFPRDVYLQEDQEAFYRRNVYLFHILAIAPLIIYIGYRGKQSDPRSFGALLWIGIFALGYHSFRFIIPRQLN